jgi:PAS domain S-box-containing protein
VDGNTRASILLVEDEPLIALSEERMLRGGGYQVTVARSGEEALELAAGEVDLILMDIDLGPGMDGIETAGKLLASRNLPLLFLTSHSEPEYAQRAENVGSYGYLMKGTAPTVMFASIRMAFRLFAAHGEIDRHKSGLMASRNMYRDLVNNLPFNVYRIDAEGRIEYVNAHLQADLGITSPDEVLGKTAYDFYPGELAAEYRSDDERVIASGEPLVKIEENISPQSGETRYVEVYKIPVTDHRGDVTGIQGVFIDRTREIHDQNHLMRVYGAMEGLISAILIMDMSGLISYVNPAFLELWGYKNTDQVIGGMVDEFWPNREKVRKVLDVIKSEGRWMGEMIGQKTSGAVVDILVSGNLVSEQEGDAQSIVVSMQDLSQIKVQQRLGAAQFTIMRYADDHDVADVMRKVLDEAEMLTGSSIGFFHFVDEDRGTIDLIAWSTNTLREFCSMEGGGTHYPLSQAGIWVEPLKTRKPVVHNEYPSMGRNGKLPPGHAVLKRELVVPVFRGEKIVAILGVGNKETPYGDDDVDLVQRFADMAFEVIKRKLADEQVKKLLEEKGPALKRGPPPHQEQHVQYHQHALPPGRHPERARGEKSPGRSPGADRHHAGAL